MSSPSELPLIFTGESVLRILAGKKTMTRRVVGPGNATFGSAPRSFWGHARLEAAFADGVPSSRQYLHVPCHRGDAESLARLGKSWRETYPDCSPCAECDRMGWPLTSHRLWPRWHVGDLLWVKETWRHAADTSVGIGGGAVYYRADEDWNVGAGWRSPMFMPRWASRLTLRVTSVGVERLQAVSDQDAVEEGFGDVSVVTPSEQFAAAWDQIGARPVAQRWAADPWVWVVGFEKVSLTL